MKKKIVEVKCDGSGFTEGDGSAARKKYGFVTQGENMPGKWPGKIVVVECCRCCLSEIVD